MAAVEYRLFFDNQPADQERLDRVEEIVVEQQVDMAAEARLSIPVCVDGDGRWQGEEEAWMRPYQRVRVEVRHGSGDFVPLIDGPIVGHDTERNSLPGKSLVKLVVHDDSALLHRDDELASYTGSDGEVARQILGAAQLGGPVEVDDPPRQPDTPYTEIRQRGTKMQLLQYLARRYRDFHAYVLPGSQPGQSIGCFKRLPTQTDGLPPLVLFGEGRNLAELQVRNNARSPAEVRAATLNFRDKSVVSATASYRDAALLGDEPPVPESLEPAAMRLPPGRHGQTSLDDAVAGAAGESGFSAEATGSVLPLCYTGVLSPYRAVAVQLSDTQWSVNYVIFRVTHTLNRDQYTQSFTLRGNAVSSAQPTSASGPAASAGLSLEFNVQMSIF